MKRFSSPSDVAAVQALFATARPNIPIRYEDLIERTGIPLRVLRDAIAKLVQSGMPIISNRNHSYMLCTDPDVIVREMRSLRSHSSKTRLRAEGLEIYLVRVGHSVVVAEDKNSLTEDEIFDEVVGF